MPCLACGEIEPGDGAFCETCGEPLRSDALAPGFELAGGNYRVEDILGQGGFGITYRALDSRLHRPVAIKEFFPMGCRRATGRVTAGGSWNEESYREARQRFLDEGRTLARFDHPGIVRVFAAFEENSTAYIVMELIDGETLESLLARRGKLAVDEALDLGSRVALALKEVHRHDLLHRDVKPSNILLSKDGRLVLVDFGTARQFASNLTSRQSVMLTPGYAPLEQYAERGRRGPFTDIYSLCATLYHALTGVCPESSPDRATGHQLAPLAELCPELPPAAAAAIEQGLEMEAGRRPQTIDEFLEALTTAATPPAEPPAPAAPPAPTPEPAPAPASTPEPAPVAVAPKEPAAAGVERARSRWHKVVLGAGGLALLLVMAGKWKGPASPRPEPSSSASRSREVSLRLDPPPALPTWKAEEGAQQCLESLSETAAVLDEYAHGNNGRYPADLKTLTTDEWDPVGLCPAAPPQGQPYYEVSSDGARYTLMCTYDHTDAGVALNYPRVISGQEVANEVYLERPAQTGLDYASKGAALLSLKKYSEAITAHQACLQFYPDFTFALTQIADAYQGLNQPAEAVAWAQKAVSSSPKDFGAQLGLLSALNQMRAYGTAEGLLDKWDQVPGADVEGLVLGRAVVNYHQGKYDEALRVAEKLKFGRYSTASLNLQIYCLAAQRKGPETIRAARTLLETLGPKDRVSGGFSCALAAAAFCWTQDEQGKADFLRQWVPQLRQDWSAPVALYAAGLIDDEELLKRAGEDLGRVTEAHAIIGLMCEATGQVGKAREHLSWVLEKGIQSYFEVSLSRALFARLPLTGSR